ncbi:efflux RND transporter periplasmic adaptor subunit [Photobacterium swingsii]|uniref:efflux RND transporter periplasmic adaptor subunit n=1 Tax=Photobacterium swingsii TaxID=680026 RepID=UPI00406883B7
MNIRTVLLPLTFPLILVGCQEQLAQAVVADIPQPKVKTQLTYIENINIDRSYPGYLEPMESVDLKARVSATILEKHFVAGQEVEKGDLLFRLDSQEFELALLKLDAEKARIAARSMSAQKNYSRAKKMGQAISQQQLESHETELKLTKAELAAVEHEIKHAQIILSRTEIFSPITGRIGQTDWSVGDLVQDGELLVNVVDDSKVKIKVSIDEETVLKAVDDYRHSDIDYSVYLNFVDGRYYDNQGRLEYVDNTVNSKTGSLQVGFLFDNDDSVFAGQYAKLTLRNSIDGTLLPEKSVTADPAGQFVYLVEEGIVARRSVETKPFEGDQVVITKGLAANELVIVEGVQKLAPGMAVNIEG